MLFIRSKLFKPNKLNILHLSDLHIQSESEANIFATQLISDLKNSLGISTLHYLIISGDIGVNSTESEYNASYEFVEKIRIAMNLDKSRIIITPGNHDLNWDISKLAYGESNIIQDKILYQKRFDNFNQYFYKALSGSNYPMSPEEQAVVNIYDDDKLIVLALNSCWEIDHHNPKKASININALSKALNEIMRYKGYLKIVVFHHPVAFSVDGEEMVNKHFMQLLSQNGFKIAIHGHIHEAEDECFKDLRENINIVGGGTFGAPANQQISGIPLQYNLLVLNKNKQFIRINTRKKEKPTGAWYPDPRWPSHKKHELLLPYHDIILGEKKIMLKLIAAFALILILAVSSYLIINFSNKNEQRNYSVVIGSSIAMMGYSNSDVGATVFEKALKSMGFEENEKMLLYNRFKSIEQSITAGELDFNIANEKKKIFNKYVEGKLYVLNGSEMSDYLQFGYDVTTLILFIKYWDKVKSNWTLVGETDRLIKRIRNEIFLLSCPETIKNKFVDFKGDIFNEPDRFQFLKMLEESLTYYDIKS